MKFCVNCGSQLDDNQRFCTNCGADQGQEESQPRETVQPQVTVEAVQAQPVNFSDWDGSVLDTFLNSLAAGLLITITCGLGTPWAICYVYRFVINHVRIDGKKLTFDGTGAQLFGNWLKWFLLTLVTCGIYGFWVAPRLYKWVAVHTHFAQ